MEIRKRRSSPWTVFEICHRPSFRVYMRWLKDKNVYGAAFKNILALNPTYSYYVGNSHNIRGYVSYMFTWMASPEDYDYWSRLSEEWWVFARFDLHGYFNSLRDKKKKRLS